MSNLVYFLLTKEVNIILTEKNRGETKAFIDHFVPIQ